MSELGDDDELDSQRTEIGPSTPAPRRRDGGGASSAAGSARSVLGVRRRNEEVVTPQRDARQMARTVSINVGDIDARAELRDHNFGAREGGILPINANVSMTRPYTGDMGCDGDCVIVLGVLNDAVGHMTFYTEPFDIGGDIVKQMEKVHKGDMKSRHPGIEWIGYENKRLPKNNYGLRKRGWFANVGTCGSSRRVLDLTKKLASEIITSGARVNFTLCNIEMTTAEMNEASRMMNRFIGRGMTFDFEVEEVNDD